MRPGVGGRMSTASTPRSPSPPHDTPPAVARSNGSCSTPKDASSASGSPTASSPHTNDERSPSETRNASSPDVTSRRHGARSTTCKNTPAAAHPHGQRGRVVLASSPHPGHEWVGDPDGQRDTPSPRASVVGPRTTVAHPTTRTHPRTHRMTKIIAGPASTSLRAGASPARSSTSAAFCPDRE
jgi:hypothetical protein